MNNMEVEVLRIIINSKAASNTTINSTLKVIETKDFPIKIRKFMTEI